MFRKHGIDERGSLVVLAPQSYDYLEGFGGLTPDFNKN